MNRDKATLKKPINSPSAGMVSSLTLSPIGRQQGDNPLVSQVDQHSELPQQSSGTEADTQHTPSQASWQRRVAAVEGHGRQPSHQCRGGTLIWGRGTKPCTGRGAPCAGLTGCAAEHTGQSWKKERGDRCQRGTRHGAKPAQHHRCPGTGDSPSLAGRATALAATQHQDGLAAGLRAPSQPLLVRHRSLSTNCTAFGKAGAPKDHFVFFLLNTFFFI